METKNADLSSLKIDRSSGLKNPELKGKRIKFISTIVGIVILLLVIYFGWKSLTNPAIEVKLTSAVLQSPSQTNAVLTASGYIVAQRKAAVASKGTGRLVYLGVVEGDRVQKDQIIARIDDSDIKAQLEQAKANLKMAQSELKDSENNFNRYKELLKTGSATQMEVDAAEFRYNRVLASIDVAKALVQGAEVAMENTLIRAPFNGTVLTKNADVGEVVAPLGAGVNSKAAVVLMADMTSLQAEIDVSESNIEKITIDQDCEIRLDAYSDKSYPGYVAKIVPTADRSKATVMVKVGFKNYDQRVLPEMSAKVLFLNENLKNEKIEDTKQLLVVPSGSVVNRNNAKIVFVVRDDKAVAVQVTTGKELGSYVEVLSGLMNGDKVIEKVDDKIKDGVKVNVK
ncbi:MAG: efflux RND transporter periplasmic adaptor subunit [Ignavibacteriae bacterium HGW-Ignavibacteriae-3]|nr:MAG: efflux RND transporter periplasmic adaptor subunit [Ignavibacteriae bacterium HGW-Ignavibacteriae-3]